MSSDGTLRGDVLSYMYFISYTIGFVSSLIIVTQTTIVTMFGPSKALKGDTSDSVKLASENMRQQQWYILNVGVVCITSIFFGVAVEALVDEPNGLAVLVVIILACFWSSLILWGRSAYSNFHVDNDITTPLGVADYAVNATNDNNEKVRLKAKGVLWVRESLEFGGNFLKRFAVLEKGCLDIYESEQDYTDHANPLNRKPIKLWQYTLETDPRKFAKSVTSIQNAMKSTLLGNEDFTLKDLMTSGHDLPHAAKHFKFALVPKISSELATTDMIELLAHEEKVYKHWLRVIVTVMNGFEAQGKLSVEQTIRSGAIEVETVVRAANV